MKKRDLLWKGIIRDFFPEFLKFFFPRNWREIDLHQGFEFLDKELEQILPASDAIDRRADLLAKVFSKTGEEFWFLIHIEVQGYFDKDFEERMYVTQYRLFERYRKEVAALALFTEDDPDFHPKQFSWKRLTTQMLYKFGTFKLLNYPPEKLAKHGNNAFALIMETAWHGVKRRKLKDEQILEIKVSLVKKLLERKYSRDAIRKILTFIKYYSAFQQAEFYLKFDEKLQPMKDSKHMGILELLEDEFRKEGIAIGFKKGEEKGIEKGIQKGIEKGIEKGKQQTLAILEMLHNGVKPSDIAQKLSVKESEVLEIRDFFMRKN